MSRKWTVMKNIIQASNRPGDLFLSLINEEGVITCANAAMRKELELGDPREADANFFDLVHPTQRANFKKLVAGTSTSTGAGGMELFIKNGQYHPMKWHVNYLKEGADSKTYLCLGYNILDHDRRKKFNSLVQQNYQLLIENLSGIIFHDKNGDIIATNQKVAAIFNTTLEQLYRLKNIDRLWNAKWIVTGEYNAPVLFSEAPFIKAIRTGKSQKETMRIITPAGDEKWLLINSQFLPETETGGDFSVMTSLVDVTNEISLSHKLKEKENIFQSFLQQTNQLAWVIDEDSTLLFASEAFYKYFNTNEKECANRNIMEIVPSPIVQTLYGFHKEVFNTGKPIATTHRVKWADGTNLISYINIFPLGTIGSKKILGGQAIELPDKSDLEKKYRQAEERLLRFSRATSDAIWEWDMQGGQMIYNETLFELIGLQPNNSRGLSWWLRQIHHEDRNRVADKVKDAIEHHEQSWTDEYRFKCADNQYKHIQHKGFVVYENGLPVKMIGSLNDVSQLKVLENKLADEKIRRQKEISEMVVKAQEKERTRIGHELHDNVNQLLSATKLFVDFLTPMGKEQKQVKQKSIDYIQLTIDEIRKLSKELVAPQLKEKGLHQSITGLVDDIELIGAMKVKFEHGDEIDELSNGKKVTLFRIAQEQLKNILKHSHAKNTFISLQVADEQVQLVITDDGDGFNPQKTSQGIGLSNIRERVNFYSGSVSINTAPGKGCTLIVTIPLQD